MQFHEDNQAAIRVCSTGRNPTMRHLGRTHGVQVSWLHERFLQGNLDLIYETIVGQAADIYTKGFTDPLKWRDACQKISIGCPDDLWKRFISPERGVLMVLPLVVPLLLPLLLLLRKVLPLVVPKVLKVLPLAVP